METGIIYYSDSKNIGDDIQTYAMSKLITNPIFLEREELNAETRNVPAVISGWFMHKPENFPPSDTLKPFFISFHAKESVVTEKHYDYYKKHEPIGCRDYSTLKLFKRIGIESYFSGCATLTIKPPVEVDSRTDEILIVDVFRANYTNNYRQALKDSLIPEKWKSKVTFISHFIEELPSLTLEERMKRTEELLIRYSKAKFVVTSLIHCALPCIAMGTPVLFIDFGFNKKVTRRDRFEGIIDMLNIYSDIRAPFAKRNFIHTSLRVLGIHHLFKNRFKPLPESFFENIKPNPPLNKDLIQNIRQKVRSFEKDQV